MAYASVKGEGGEEGRAEEKLNRLCHSDTAYRLVIRNIHVIGKVVLECEKD